MYIDSSVYVAHEYYNINRKMGITRRKYKLSSGMLKWLLRPWNANDDKKGWNTP